MVSFRSASTPHSQRLVQAKSRRALYIELLRLLTRDRLEACAEVVPGPYLGRELLNQRHEKPRGPDVVVDPLTAVVNDAVHGTSAAQQLATQNGDGPAGKDGPGWDS